MPPLLHSLPCNRRCFAPPTPEIAPMQERPNAVKFKDKSYTLVGPQLKPGDTAPDFACVKVLDVVKLADTGAKARLFSVVPSLDTPVCHQQTKRFEETIVGLKD